MPNLTDPIGDVSHATREAAELFAAFHTAKSAHDVGGTMSFFSREKLTYTDATLGWQWSDFGTLEALFGRYMPGWGEGVSYATRVLGDERSAAVFVTDTPELFGGEIRTISAVDLENGKIVRFVDYWDGRSFGAEAAAQMKTYDERFPRTFGEESTPSQASESMLRLAERLGSALSDASASDAAPMFATDAAVEDLTLRTTVRGRDAIERYLRRAAGALPYGAGSAALHVLGHDRGGGYEWTNRQHDAARGMVALEIDGGGQISKLTAVWDGTLVDDDTLARLSSLSLEA